MGNKKALLLFFGLVLIFAGAWVRYVFSPYLVVQAVAWVIILFGVSRIVKAFRCNRKSAFL